MNQTCTITIYNTHNMKQGYSKMESEQNNMVNNKKLFNIHLMEKLLLHLPRNVISTRPSPSHRRTSQKLRRNCTKYDKTGRVQMYNFYKIEIQVSSTYTIVPSTCSENIENVRFRFYRCWRNRPYFIYDQSDFIMVLYYFRQC